MIRLAPLLAAAAILLSSVRPAFAAGGVLTTPGDAVAVTEVRYAMAMSAAQTTRWATLRLARFPPSMAWILPVRPGARVEEVGDAWFEALDVATAPRVISSVCGDGGSASNQVVTERLTPLGNGVGALRSVLLDDVAALRAFAQGSGFQLTPEMDGRCEEVAARGFLFLALGYGGPSEGHATRTVRITDDAFPWVPLFLTAASDDPVPVTTFILADSRTRLGPEAELEVDAARIASNKNGTTTYGDELRASLLGARGRSWVTETASHDVLFDGARGPAGTDPTPALAPTYFRLASSDDHTDASDLPLALSDLDLSGVWLTRASGIVPPRSFGDDLAVMRREAARKSPFISAGTAAPCPVSDAGPPGGGSGGRGSDGGGAAGSAPPSPPTLPPPATEPPRPPTNRQPAVSGEVSCACSPGPGQTEPASGDDSCDGSDPGTTTEPDEACDGSADDSSGDSCNGSADDSSDTTDEGCDGSSSGTGDDGGCSSGSPDGNDGCSSNSSSSSSQGCSTAPNGRTGARMRRGKASGPRTSVMTVALAAVALVLRRRTKRRGEPFQRRASTGANIGFGQ